MLTLNNEGVAMNLDGRYDQAIKVFASVLEALELPHDQRSGSSMPCNVADYDPSAEAYCTNSSEQLVPLATQDSNNHNAMAGSQHSPFRRFNNDSVYVFRFPVLVVDEIGPGRHTNHESGNPGPYAEASSFGMSSSITMPRAPCNVVPDSRQVTKIRFDFVLNFNLALTYHLSGLIGPQQEESKTSLQSAIVHYERAYRILMSSEEVLVSRAMIILNNVGQIYRRLKIEHNAKLCFERLLSIMLILHENGDSSRVEYWSTFVSNLRSGLISSGVSSFDSICLNAPAA